MSILKSLAAAAVLATPLLLSITPAQAITSQQYASQGRGYFTSSKGHPAAGYRPYHRSWPRYHQRRRYY